MSNKERRKAPVLRFKGFTDDWEQRKFSDIAQRISTNININLPNVTYDDIDSENETLNKGIKNLSSGKKGILFQKNDILFGKLRPYLNNIIKVDFKGIAVGDFWVLRAYEDSSFLFSLINSPQYKYIANISSGSKMPRSDWNLVSKYLFCIPSEKEQSHIGNLILKLSQQITLQQRKLDRLLLLKKAYLSNLLPDKTQNPKVRFKEFNDKWKTLKLGNISSISAGGDVNKQKLLKKGRYPVIANALTNKAVIGYYESEYRIQAPAVTVTGRGDIGHAYARKTNFTPVVRLLSVKSKHNVDFLAEAINQKKVPFESTGVPQLTVPKLSNYKILFPSSITEENKIGNFIIKFDEIINLQNKKISSLEQVKNFLLQNMFI